MNSTPSIQPARGRSTLPSQKAGKRRWLPYAGAIALLALIVAGLWPRPVPAEIAEVHVGRLRVTVNEEGKTRIRERFVVAAPVTGQLRRIELEPGAEVQAGTSLVAIIDPVLPAILDARTRIRAEAQRDAAMANLEKARAAHRFARQELERFRKLYEEEALSIQELEPVQWREAAAARDLTAAESAFRQAEAELAEFTPRPESPQDICRTTIEVKAPSDGRVLRVFEESARVVAAGTALMEIGNPADLEAVVEVLSRDGAAIMPGFRAELEQWGGGPPLQAKVKLVEPAAFTKVSALGVEEQRVNVVLDILTPPAERRSLGDNFRVDARIILWEADQILQVPSGALFRQGTNWAVFVWSDGRARLRLPQVGRSSGIETQILSGLQQGEQVILYPGDRVQDGLRVAPANLAPKG